MVTPRCAQLDFRQVSQLRKTAGHQRSRMTSARIRPSADLFLDGISAGAVHNGFSRKISVRKRSSADLLREPQRGYAPSSVADDIGAGTVENRFLLRRHWRRCGRASITFRAKTNASFGRQRFLSGSVGADTVQNDPLTDGIGAGTAKDRSLRCGHQRGYGRAAISPRPTAVLRFC